MSSLYFATSKRGYIQTTIDGVPKHVSGRQIPVYLRVNEYMHNQPEENDKNIIKEVDEQTEYFQPQKSTRSLNIAMQKGISCTLVKSAHLLQKLQENSQNGDDIHSSLIKQRQYSSKDTSASQMDFVNRKKGKISIIESEIGKNQDYEDIFDRKELQRQIEKQKELRKNLENSYMNLLQKLRADLRNRSKDFTHESLSQRKRPNKKQKPVFHPEIQEKQFIIENFMHRREKSQCSERSNNSQQIKLSNRKKVGNDMEQSIYQQHLKRERYFQQNLLEQIKSANERIDDLEDSLAKRQIQLQKLKRQKQVKQHSNQYCSIKSGDYCQKRQNHQDLKNQIHYIFTIFVMFLIIAMITKNRQK